MLGSQSTEPSVTQRKQQGRRFIGYHLAERQQEGTLAQPQGERRKRTGIRH